MNVFWEVSYQFRSVTFNFIRVVDVRAIDVCLWLLRLQYIALLRRGELVVSCER